MNKLLRYVLGSILTMGLISCGGTSSSSSNGGGGPVPTTTATINIGNISTIPLGLGSTGKSTVTVTNNLKNTISLVSATYTISSNGSSGNPISTSASGSLVDTHQCASISPGGVCSIAVNPPANTSQSQYVVEMKYIDNTTGKLYVATNMVSYSDSIPATDTGARYSTVNNSIYNETGGATTITIPFQLTKNFASLEAKSTNANPVFAPTISCPGNSYTAGTLCNLYVNISNLGTISMLTGSITVSGEPLVTNESKRLKSINGGKAKSAALSGEAGYIFNVPITVSQNLTGNLVTSANNLVVSPSNGSSPQSVTLLNNGTATISNITVNGNTPVTISGNNCSSLVVGASCAFNVDVNSATSGQSSVTVSYNNGASSGNTTGLLTFNVVYISATFSPGLSLTSGQGDLNNVPVDTTRYYNITVNNTGNTTLSNIAFTNNFSAQDSSFSWSAGSCATNGTQTLGAGESCTLVLQYSPTVANAGATLSINAMGTWQDQAGNPQTYADAALAVAYSAVVGNAFLYITPNYTSFAIRADGADNVTQTYTVVNGGLSPTSVGSLSVAPGITGFSNLGTGTCAVGTNLAVNAFCTINTKFGPTTSVLSNVESRILVSYDPGNSTTVTAFANLVFNSSSAAYVNISNIAVTGNSGGSGTSGSPYTYTNTSATGGQLTVVVTYANTGTAAAESFNVALNNLPIGYTTSGSGNTCGIGSNTTSLGTGSSCTVSFYAVNPSGLYNPLALSGTGLQFNIPGFSYKDTNTGLNTNPNPTWGSNFGGSNTIYVTTNLFANITTSAPTWTTASAGGTNNFTFTGSGSNGAVITIPSDQLSGFTVGGSRTCTISSNSCSISITNPANFPTGTVYFSYYVTPSGVATPSSTNSLIQQGSFTLN